MRDDPEVAKVISDSQSGGGQAFGIGWYDRFSPCEGDWTGLYCTLSSSLNNI